MSQTYKVFLQRFQRVIIQESIFTLILSILFKSLQKDCDNLRFTV